MRDIGSEAAQALARAKPNLDGAIVEVSRGREHSVVSYGRWADESSPSADSLFYAASLTKQLIGLLVAIAVDSGELDPGDSLRTWLPTLPPWTAAATVSQLLHHTAGLPREMHSHDGARSTCSTLASVEALTVPAAPPGARFEYSNDGYVLLALIVEKAAGRPIARLADNRIFTPLGMTHSTLTTRPCVTVPEEPDPPSTIGDGGWWTTVTDVGRLLRHLNRDVLGARVMETRPLTGGQPTDYGWGVRVVRIGERLAASHGGSWERWQSKTVRIPSCDCAVVVAARSSNAQTVSGLGTELAGILAEAL